MTGKIEWVKTRLHISPAIQYIRRVGTFDQIDYVGLANHASFRDLPEWSVQGSHPHFWQNAKRLLDLLPACTDPQLCFESYCIHDADTLDLHYLCRVATHGMARPAQPDLPAYGEAYEPGKNEHINAKVFIVATFCGLETYLTGRSIIYLGKVRRIPAKDFYPLSGERQALWIADVVNATASHIGPEKVGKHVELLEAIDPGAAEVIQMLRVPVKVKLA